MCVHGCMFVHVHVYVWCVLILSYAVADADATVKNLEQEADRLINKLKPIKELEDNLKKNISEIKELINQARKQANSVSCFYLQYQSLVVVLLLFPGEMCSPRYIVE